jgi:hypothetical protein
MSVEALALHFRNVIDFLYPRGGMRADDVVAAHFLPAGDWDAIRPVLSTSLIDARSRGDKEMMHLTTARIFGTPVEKNWDPKAIADEVRPTIELFCNKALSTRLSPKLSQVVKTNF